MTDRATLVKALRILAREIDSQDGAANAVCEEAANVIEERRWIPVGERLPEIGDRVMVSAKDGCIEIGSVSSSPYCGGTCWYIHAAAEAHGFSPLSCFPHWHPLPAPPNGGEAR